MDFKKSENKEAPIYELMKIIGKIISILSSLTEAISDIYGNIDGVYENMFIIHDTLNDKIDHAKEVSRINEEILDKKITIEGKNNKILQLETKILKLSLFDQFIYLMSIFDTFGRMNIIPREFEEIASDPAYRRFIVDFSEKHLIDVNEYFQKKYGLEPIIVPAEVIPLDEYAEKKDKNKKKRGANLKSDPAEVISIVEDLNENLKDTDKD